MARTADPAWRGLYEEERDALLLQRLAWCAALALLCGLGVGASAVLLRPFGWAAHARSGATFVAVSLPVGALTLVAAARPWATWLGGAYLLGLTAVLTTTAPGVPGLVALTPAILVAVLLGTTLLLPWGALRQAVVATGALAVFAAVAADGSIDPPLSATYLVLSAAAVSVVGARHVDHYRATGFERAWVQEQLVASARALARHVETADVVATLVEHVARLVPAHAIVVALRDSRRGTIRVVADTSPSPVTQDLEVPDTLEPVQALLSDALVCLPDDDPASPINTMLAQYGVARVLYAALRHAGEPIGLLAFVRHEAAPFTDAERLIVRGIVEQAALALATARVVADLRAADQLKTEFVSTMSHELRTPLNVIIGFAEMLKDHQLEPAERERAVDRIELAGRDLLELIENTLAIGRIDAGRDEPRLAAVDVPSLWRTIGERCARMPRRSEVVLAWGDAPAVTVRSDPHKLEVVVANLVGNALKFTERGHVEATIRADGTDLVLRVVDTGIGIRADDRTHVFEMFRQVDASDSRRYGGTGLGLYIVRRFAQQLGGTVELESTPGQGSTFTVRLAGALASSTVARAA